MGKFIILFITALIPLHTLAQSAHISGTIEDEYGVPLAGVNVMIKGTGIIEADVEPAYVECMLVEK